MMADVSQSLYEMVNRECEILSAVLKGTCRATRVNVSASINANGYGNQPCPVVNATANAMFEITPTQPATPAPDAK